MRFEDLDVWKRAARLSADLHRALDGSREYGFKDQIIRSALSIASNMAEGCERDTVPERVKFLHYSKGSCGELRTQLYTGIEAEYIDPKPGRAWVCETVEISRMLAGLTRSFRAGTHPAGEPCSLSLPPLLRPAMYPHRRSTSDSGSAAYLM